MVFQPAHDDPKSKLMEPLEEVIRLKFIPSLLGDKSLISDEERDLFALPARLSGLWIANPVKDSI